MTADIRAQITQRIIDAIEQGGLPPWRKGWVTGGGLHLNGATSRPYRGLNQILLALSANELPPARDGQPDLSDPRWMTLKQANALNLKISKGAKAAQIVRMVEVERAAPTRDSDEVLAEDKQTKLVLKLFHVFHASQIEGLAPLPARDSKVTPIAAAEAMVAGMKADGVTVLHGGSTASYIERLDTVRLPERAAFHSTEDFYATALHEMAHAVGSEKRLKRPHHDAKFGSAAYAREELVAEIAAAMACGESGIPLGPTCIAQHAAYVSSWLECLKADKNAIFAAAGAAERACEYLRTHAAEVKPQEVEAVVVKPPAPEVATPRRRRGMRM
jgi:antirestriction protein ArdC